MNQASMLLNDRLASLQGRCRTATVTSAQCTEICEIADGILAASYYTQKWAFALGAASQSQRPNKPTPCDDVEQALCSMRVSLPRLMVSSAEAQKKLTDLIKERGAEGAE